LFAGLLTAFVIASAGMALIIDGQSQSATGFDKFNYGMESNEMYSSQNFTSNNTYSASNVFGVTDYSGAWTQSDIGFTLTDGAFFLVEYPQLLFKNVQKINDKYDTIYQINNSVHGEYIIYVRRTNNFVSFGDNIEVKIDSDGMHVRQFDILAPLGYDVEFFADSSIINTDEVEIRTVYDNIQNTLDVYYQGNLIMQATNLKSLSWISAGTFYYAGVASRTVGFTLIALPSTSISEHPINSNNTGMDNILSFLTTFLGLLLWNVDEQYMPWVFNIVFIKIPELALFVWGLVLIRSG
jgi:hypothetical protein